MKFQVRRFIKGDEKEICKIIKKDILRENINDYSTNEINDLIEQQNEELILRRSEKFHVYVFLDKNKIVGVGMIGPYWDSLTESSFFTIFIDPDYKGKGLGRKIIETLENDEYYKRADRVEIPASITAVEFYKHFGWGFKHLGNIVDEEGIYRMEKFPKVGNNNANIHQYNMRPYIDNEYHNYKEFIYQLRKDTYKKYFEENNVIENEEQLKKIHEEFIKNPQIDLWIIQLNGENIGFYNGIISDNCNYQIENICIIPKYQGMGIENQIEKDIIELNKKRCISKINKK